MTERTSGGGVGLLGGNKESIQSKEAVDLLEVIDIFNRILKYCKAKIKIGWQRRGLCMHCK